MKRLARFLLAALLGVSLAAMAFGNGQQQTGNKNSSSSTSASAPAAATKQYTFYFISHIGSGDPNHLWLTKSTQAFEKVFPNVHIYYEAPAVFSVKATVDMLKAAIAKHPDGIITTIPDAQAMQPALDNAINNLHIPVIAVNNPDYRPASERIPYMSYIGEDEFKTGQKLGDYLYKEGQNGAVPAVTGVVVAIQNPGQTALEERAKGMADAMKAVGVKTYDLAIGTDPAKGKSLLTSFLVSHKDVNAIFTVASWTAPWAYTVAKSLDRAPGSGPNAYSIVTCDGAPVALEGILKGYVLATSSQQFWLQGWLPAMWMYLHVAFGYQPPPEILTGPIVVNKTNVQRIKKTVIDTFGKKTYDNQILWKE